MKKRMLLTSIASSTIVIAILFFSSSAISAGLDDIEKFSPLSEQNMPVLTRDENITSFIQPDGQVGIGYRCGTLPPTVEQAEAVQQAIDELKNRGISLDIPCTVNIPVAFHILRYDDGVTGDVTDQQINDQITVLNNAYASTNFQFVLDSIERVDNTTWSLLNTSPDEVAVKQALAISPATTLNFYTCTGCMGYLGWAYFPSSYPEDSYIHGVVVLYSSLPGGSTYPYDEGDTGTHEVGHYLGLYHTFQGGCTSPGDYVDDTPYEESPAFGCPIGRDTCLADPGLDPIYNFMDYSDDACMNNFTANQSVRTDSMVETYKPSLISCGLLQNPDTTGVFRPTNGALYLKNQNTTGFADMMLTYGLPADKPITGDWDGDGVDTIGIYRNGVFYLRNSNTNGFADIVFAFGAPTDQPIAGDWDGDGVDTIGLYRDGIIFLRNSNSSGPADMTFFLGVAGDIGIAGDWDGDGIDTTGVFRPTNGALYLKNQNTTGFADVVLTYGLPGDKPVTGDWDGDGIDTIGVYRNGTFMLRNSNTNGFADITFTLGIPSDEPISGDWDGLP